MSDSACGVIVTLEEDFGKFVPCVRLFEALMLEHTKDGDTRQTHLNVGRVCVITIGDG